MGHVWEDSQILDKCRKLRENTKAYANFGFLCIPTMCIMVQYKAYIQHLQEPGKGNSIASH